MYPLRLWSSSSSPRFFTHLAFLALLTALGMLYWLSSVQTPAAGERGEAARRRVASDVLSAGRTAAAEDGSSETAALPAAGVPQDVTTAEAGRIRAAQRAFLAEPSRWTAAQAPVVGTASWFYFSTRKDWMDRVLRAPGYNLTTTAQLQSACAQLDKACADLTLLTPEAKKSWRDWQSGKWQGWDRPDPNPPGPGKADQPASDAPRNAVEETVAKCHGQILPLLKEYEYLLNLRESSAQGTDETATGAPDPLRAAADAQIARVEQEIAATAGLLQKEIRREVQLQRVADMQNTVK